MDAWVIQKGVSEKREKDPARESEIVKLKAP